MTGSSPASAIGSSPAATTGVCTPQTGTSATGACGTSSASGTTVRSACGLPMRPAAGHADVQVLAGHPRRGDGVGLVGGDALSARGAGGVAELDVLGDVGHLVAGAPDEGAVGVVSGQGSGLCPPELQARAGLPGMTEPAQRRELGGRPARACSSGGHNP